MSDISTNTSDIAENTANNNRAALLAKATLSADFANNKYELYDGPVNSLTTVAFGGMFTFDRNSAATARTAIQTLEAVSTDQQRLIGNREGLLVEEERTNLFLNSDTLSTQDVTVAAKEHTLHFTGTGTVTLSGTFTGSLVGTGTGEANRVSLTFTPTAGTLTATVTGSVVDAQVEEGSFPTSYIPTAGTQVTRAADNCVRTLGDEFNPNEFSFYLEAPIPRLFDDRNAHLIEFSDGANNNRYILQRVVNSTDLVFAGITSANGVIFTMTLGIAALSNQTAKISASVSSTSATLVVDGVSVSDTVSDALPVVTQFNLGAKWDGSNSIGEAVFKDVQLFPTALSESELITLTGG